MLSYLGYFPVEEWRLVHKVEFVESAKVRVCSPLILGVLPLTLGCFKEITVELRVRLIPSLADFVLSWACVRFGLSDF